MSWYPVPDATPQPTTSNPFASNYVGPAPSNSDNKTYLIKIDQNVGERDSFDATGSCGNTMPRPTMRFPETMSTRPILA